MNAFLHHGVKRSSNIFILEYFIFYFFGIDVFILLVKLFSRNCYITFRERERETCQGRFMQLIVCELEWTLFRLSLMLLRVSLAQTTPMID
jgi:hypothetical protein